jgi:hypothetical protein
VVVVTIQHRPGPALAREGDCAGGFTFSFAGDDTGYLQWFVDGTPVGGPDWIADGVADLPVTTSPGTHSVHAVYGGKQFSISSGSYTCP